MMPLVGFGEGVRFGKGLGGGFAVLVEFREGVEPGDFSSRLARSHCITVNNPSNPSTTTHVTTKDVTTSTTRRIVIPTSSPSQARGFRVERRRQRCPRRPWARFAHRRSATLPAAGSARCGQARPWWAAAALPQQNRLKSLPGPPPRRSTLKIVRDTIEQQPLF